MGLDTDCAAGEFEATQLLRKHGYDLCLTDMRLPDGDGLKLLEHVGQNDPTRPCRDHGVWQRRECGRRVEGGRLRLPGETGLAEPLRALVRSAPEAAAAAAQRGNATTKSWRRVHCRSCSAIARDAADARR